MKHLNADALDARLNGPAPDRNCHEGRSRLHHSPEKHLMSRTSAPRKLRSKSANPKSGTKHQSRKKSKSHKQAFLSTVGLRPGVEHSGPVICRVDGNRRLARIRTPIGVPLIDPAAAISFATGY